MEEVTQKRSYIVQFHLYKVTGVGGKPIGDRKQIRGCHGLEVEGFQEYPLMSIGAFVLGLKKLF